RLGVDRLPRGAKLDRYRWGIRLGSSPAVLWRRCFSASGVRDRAWNSLVQVIKGRLARGQAAWRNLAADVRPGTAGALAGTSAVAGRRSARRAGWASARRRAYSLFQSGRRMDCFDNHAGSGTLFLHGILFLSGKSLGSHSLFVRCCIAGSLSRLARPAPAKEDAEGIGKTSCRTAYDSDPDGTGTSSGPK